MKIFYLGVRRGEVGDLYSVAHLRGFGGSGWFRSAGEITQISNELIGLAQRLTVHHRYLRCATSNTKESASPIRSSIPEKEH